MAFVDALCNRLRAACRTGIHSACDQYRAHCVAALPANRYGLNLPRSFVRSNDTRFEQVDFLTSVHLPLDEFELDDQSFYIVVRALWGYRILDHCPVTDDAVGERRD